MDPVHVVCPHCDAVNRVPAARLGQGGKCGKCGSALFERRPLELDAARFSRHLSRSDVPLVVDFWAAWCGPCKMMAPMFHQAAAQLEPQVRLVKINTEENQSLAGQLGIRSIPTMALFRGGREVARQAGAMDAASIMGWVRSHLGS
ncbi:MAG: thioredoxin TrxC [Pseudomonadota bacterium]